MNTVNVKRNLGHILAKSMVVLFGFMVAEASFAEALGTVASNIYKNFGNLTQLITSVSYLAGLGFAIGAIIKFKQHKDNPTQVTIGTPVALIFVAAALLFLPSILSVTGATLFGTSGGTVAGATGLIYT